MADGTPILDGLSVQEVIETDELATVNGVDVSGANPRRKAQRTKVVFGSDGAAQDVDATHGLPVTPATAATFPVSGTVAVSAAPAAGVATDSIAAAPLAETSAAGATPYHLISAASTNATSVKGSVGKVYYIAAFNLNAAPRYLKLYDKASAPTVGTDVPKHTFMLPGNTTGSGFTLDLGVPAKFALGIALAITTGIGDGDSSAVAANEIVVNLGYI